VVGPLTPVSASVARASIARAILGVSPHAPRIGRIVLLPHQETAAARVEAAMRELGGALLADETGLGKTYVALAIARCAARPLIVAPAGLRAMWGEAMRAAEMSIPLTSFESLSRTRTSVASDVAPDLVVVDEAHHVRNPATARYRRLAALTENARVLLLSATPIHNSPRDLHTLLALFLGARAGRLDASTTARCIIRREHTDAPAGRLPRVESAQPLSIAQDEGRLDAILALPPPVPPSDGGDGGVLLVYSLIRQWASSQGALLEALRRRRARAISLLAALESGRHPTRDELAAWTFAEGAVQLAFGELLADPVSEPASVGPLRTCVLAHDTAVSQLLAELKAGPDPDADRARHLIDLMRRHRGEKIVAFSQYAETVTTLFHHLRASRGVAALTADGGTVAGGAISRGETIARFAPRAQGASPPGPAHAIDFLLTTDLLSEGVNLQDASVVIHLDLPWTPARLEQRIGRVARIGSSHANITVYAMQPPASAERIVRVEERLRTKLGATSRAIGVVGTILPSLLAAPAAAAQSGPQSDEASRRRMADWIGRGFLDSADSTLSPGGLVASVAASISGFIALLQYGPDGRLVADIGTGPSDDPSVILAAIVAADGKDAVPDATAVTMAGATIDRWLATQRVHRELTLVAPIANGAQRHVVERIAAITNRAPPHLRPSIAALAAHARSTMTGRFGAGAERVLDELASAQMADEAWLRALTTFGELHRESIPDAPVLRVLIVLSVEG
jgi:hypothetical protein